VIRATLPITASLALLAAAPTLGAPTAGPDPSRIAQGRRGGGPVSTDPRRLTPAGFGPLKAGATVAEAARALRAKLQEPPGAPACHTLESADLPGVTLVVEDGKVVRVDAYAPSYRTDKDLRVGMKEAEAKARYPGLRIAPHRYDPTGHYLIVASADRTSALVLETDGGRVTAIRTGGVSAVERPDPCP